MTTTPGTITRFSSASEAAQQALTDVNNTKVKALTGLRDPAVDPFTIAGAIGSIASAVAGAAQLGVGIAGLVQANSSASTDSLEVSIENWTQYPIVLQDYTPDHADIADLPVPLQPGESDIVVITGPDGDQFGSESSVALNFLIGKGASSAVNVALKYNRSSKGDPGRWAVGARFTGENDFTVFDKRLGLLGATFSGNDGYPSFSFYTSSIETSTGKINLTFYDLGT